MPTPPVSDETLLATYNAWLASGKSNSAAARVLGCAEASVRRHLQFAARRGLIDRAPVMPGFGIAKVSQTLDDAGKLVREHIQQKPLPDGTFTMPDGHSLKGVSALLDADGNVLQQWVKTRRDDGIDPIEVIREAFAEYEGRAPVVVSPDDTCEHLLTVYPLADVHLGLMSWAPETGENFDLSIGVERLRACMAQVVSQSPASGTGLVLGLGDFFHADDQRNVTPASGHRLDVDGRYPKVLAAGVRLMMESIDMALGRHERVIVRVLPGNHDPHATVALLVALNVFYAANPRVTVDDSPSEWFFHRFGSVLLGANHGHRAKPADMAMNMAVQRPGDWGETRFRHFFFGHIHHETAKEVMGVRCESFNTITGKDAYSAASGYMSGQALASVTFHKTRGEVTRQRVNVL